ncbi:unnamed protein product [Sympodiomycopsis kandeliae]
MSVQTEQQQEDLWLKAPQFDTCKSPSEVVAVHATDFDCSDIKGKKKQVPPAQRFWRRAAWSPEGTHVLAQTDDHHLDLFHLIGNADPSASTQTTEVQLGHVFRISAPTTLLDWTWYPFARYSDPLTFCFVLSARDVPVRLVDGYSGATRATYGIENHIEQFVGPNALAFSTDGASLYCGHATSLSIFDLANPGTNTCSTLSLTPTRGSKGSHLQKGIVSCISVAPIYQQEGQEDVTGRPVAEHIAVGTFNGTVGVYQRTAMHKPGQWIDAAKQPTAIQSLGLAGWLEQQGSGIMQLKFHPTAPHILLLSNRGSAAAQTIKAYDLRYVNSTPSFEAPASESSLLATFLRCGGNQSPTNDLERGQHQQRLWFDVDWTGRCLVAGDLLGQVHIWRLEDSQEGEGFDHRKRRPVLTWQAADDSIGSAHFHPAKQYILTSCGSRNWHGTSKASVEHTSNSASDGDSDSEDESSIVASFPKWHVKEGALQVWNLEGDATLDSQSADTE